MRDTESGGLTPQCTLVVENFNAVGAAYHVLEHPGKMSYILRILFLHLRSGWKSWISKGGGKEMVSSKGVMSSVW